MKQSCRCSHGKGIHHARRIKFKSKEIVRSQCNFPGCKCRRLQDGENATIRFRQAVASEFERLVRGGHHRSRLPEHEESELDAIEESYTEAQQ
jgi:hypothetical protein